jgi:hypothetical protein
MTRNLGMEKFYSDAICEIRRRVAAALCRCAFRIQPDNQPIVIYDGMGAWPLPLPTPKQQAFTDWLFSDTERAKRERELRAYRQARVNAAAPVDESVSRQSEALEMSV